MPCQYCFTRPKILITKAPTYDEATNTLHLNFPTEDEIMAANRCWYCEYLETLEPEPVKTEQLLLQR